MPFTRAALDRWARATRKDYERELATLVELPSVSVDPARTADVRRTAEHAVALIHARGGKARVIETGGHPLVHGRFHRDDRLPTVTVYNHLDVQPADGPDWRTSPFTFTRRGERYFGRGTTDDKGPALAALLGAAHALGAGVAANVHFLWELEEEIGSPHFEATLRRHQKTFATDAIVVSDTIWVSRERPACPAGLRGLQGFRLTLRTGETDQHSGTTGGAARNPIAELAALLTAMFDARTGRVKMPGFYDDVVRPTRRELDDLRRCGFSVAAFKRDHGFRSLRSNDALDVMQRLWCLPTLEVHGIAGGYQGPGVKTVVPPAATAIVSCRLVPDMRPERIMRLVRAFVRRHAPDVQVEPEHALAPFRGHTTGPHADAVSDAMHFAFGRKPVFVREGGSIGAVVSMERVLRAPVHFLGLSLPEHGYHAPNENFDWPQARGGMVAFARWVERVATLPRAR
ncbi:MAG TPA: M20/M25/M40 family metallo-hydrolase [Candidatus Binatia bacterium]|jgi:acetylornithine deacetylase/succinyl-diaminopimelate desuccinylase-like protein|nr:M20/M25/M40 family metallo-hydrolase [Candidatus Binatia bacterium]